MAAMRGDQIGKEDVYGRASSLQQPRIILVLAAVLLALEVYVNSVGIALVSSVRR